MDNDSYNHDNTVMDIYQTRRRNLQLIADERFPGHGQRTRLADFMGWSQPRASAILREKNPKNIGGTASRLIEQAFKLPRGWLDEQHFGLWEGTAGSIKEYMRPVYTTARADIETKGLPLLRQAEAVRWISGERFDPSSEINFPLLPMMKVSESGFVLEETTSSMPPQKPGDFYYIDPLTPPESGDWAAFVISGKVIVGIYEKGHMRDRIAFTDGKEDAIEVSESQHAGKVLTRMNGDFARSFSNNKQ